MNKNKESVKYMVCLGIKREKNETIMGGNCECWGEREFGSWGEGWSF